MIRRIYYMELPLELQIAIENEAASVPVKKIAALVKDLSDRYRMGRALPNGKFLNSTDYAIAYAAYRLPGTYAAIYSVLTKVKSLLPAYNPGTFLDIGAGPGTAMWGTALIWPHLEELTLLEREECMINIGKRLASHSDLNLLREAKWIKADILHSENIQQYDLVVASYVLGELPIKNNDEFINKCWNSTRDMLVIIEPGTPEGFSRINRARDLLLKSGAKMIAPCPHNKICPIDDSDWCHFCQRISRSRLHRFVKGGELAYEDEKFSFVCMARNRTVDNRGIILRHPQIRKGYMSFKICTPEGLKNVTVTRKDRNLYRKARNLNWGSFI